VRGDELLLLADRRQEAERVRAEADHSDGGHGDQSARGGERRVAPPPPTRLGEHEERQQQPRCQLHADAAGERERRPARALLRAERQPE
jgi:hypothetical protein